MLDALKRLLGSDDPSSPSHAFRVEDETVVEDVFAGIEVGDGYSYLLAASSTAQLLRLVTPALTGAAVYVDRIPDPTGANRVYLRDEETYPGNMWLYLGPLAEVMPWLERVANGSDASEPPQRDLDEWENDTTSGNVVLERLLEEELPELWRSGPRGGDVEAIDDADRAPGWQRRRCLAALAAVAASGRLPPNVDTPDFSDGQRRFVAHLHKLAGDLPEGLRASVTKLGETPLDALADHLEITSEAAPIDRLGPNDALIAVRSANVGWVDLLMASGQYQHVPEPPYTPGLEFAGEVVAVGDEANLVAGTRVIANGLRTGPRSLGEHRRWGGFASYAIAPADALLPLPDTLSFDEGACLFGGAITAYHALITRADVKRGESVLVLGATGSTGLAAVSLAKRLGATVIAVGRTEAKLEVTKTYGADHLVVLDEPAALRDRVKALTDGRGADVVYDAVGGELSMHALRAARFGARFVVVGWASTPFAGRAQAANVLPTNLILMKSIDVLGSPAAIAAHRDPALAEKRLEDILAWAKDLRPHVAASFALTELSVALEAKWSGKHPGNVVVRP